VVVYVVVVVLVVVLVEVEVQVVVEVQVELATTGIDLVGDIAGLQLLVTTFPVSFLLNGKLITKESRNDTEV